MKQITMATLLCLSIVGCAGREDWTPKNLSRATPATTATSTTTTTSAPVEAKSQPATTSEPAAVSPPPQSKGKPRKNVHR
jgi:hypothetical protein